MKYYGMNGNIFAANCINDTKCTLDTIINIYFNMGGYHLVKGIISGYSGF
jgi:hypothetical protein